MSALDSLEPGTPEWDVWVAAVEVALYPPLTFKGATTQVSTRRIAALREALDAVGVNWRAAKVKDDANRAEARTRVAARRRAER